MSDATWAIIVAGGEGRRFGRPKQFELLAGQSVVAWAVASAQKTCAGVVLVLPSDALDDPSQHCDASVVVVAGGATRSASVRAGLSAVPDDAEIVVVHDAARPLASTALFDAVIAAVRAGADAAIPGLPVADTLKRVEDGRVVGTLERNGVFAVQTPQAFRVTALRRAHADGADATDDAGLVEASGGTVVIVKGEVRNVKLTEHADLALFESWIASRTDVPS